MNFSLDWYDPEHTILYMTVEGVWEMDAAQRTTEVHKLKLLEVTHTVDLVMHALDKEAMNLPTWMLRFGTKNTVVAPANTGLTVMIPKNIKILAFTDAGIRVLGDDFRDRLHTADTLEEAVLLIHELRDKT